MFFSKSIAFDEDDLGSVAVASQLSHAYASAEPEFVELLRSGDPGAFDNLVTRHSGEVYGFLYRLTGGDAEEAGDLTQETFLAAFKAIRSFRGDAEPKTWLFRIAVNQSRNRFRWWKRRRRGSTVSLDVNIGESDTPMSDMIADGGMGPEDQVLSRERERRLVRALAALPDAYRESVILCDVQGMSYEEIAIALAVNIGTVKSRIARGREELRKRLSDF